MKKFSFVILILSQLQNVIVKSDSSQGTTLQLQARSKSTSDTLSSTKIKKKGSEQLNFSFEDVMYTGVIEVGTPAQPITVIFDTGSTDVWLSSSCMCEHYKDYCSSHKTFNHKLSSTYKRDGRIFTITYVSGFVSGVLGIDNFQVGGLHVKGQVFAEAIELVDYVLNGNFDGVVGLSFPALSTIPADPLFVNMVNQKVVKEAVFSFYLSKKIVTAEITFGGVNTNRIKENFTFVPIINDNDWIVEIDEIKVQDQIVSGPYPACIDSGTSLIQGPEIVMDKINEILKATYNDSLGVFVVNCNTLKTLPTVYINIETVLLSLNHEDYIIQVKDDQKTDVCVSAFLGIEDYYEFLLGIPFMQTYVTQYDMKKKRIGFARASQNFMDILDFNAIL